MLRKIYPVLLLSFVNTLGFSILIPVLPFIIRESAYPDFVYGILISAYSLSQYFASLILGNLSDLHGRKPILLVSQAGTLLSWFIFAGAWLVGEYFGWVFLSLFIIAFARITDGLTGGNTTVANAYLSDILAPKEKAVAFGYVGGVVGLGIIIGPAIGSFTSISKIGYLGTVIFSIVLSTITLISISIFLKESLSKKHQEEYQKEYHSEGNGEKYFFIKKNFQNINIFNSIKVFKKNQIIMSVLLLKFFISIILAAYSTTIVFLVIDRFHFNQTEVGYFLLAVGSFLIFNQMFLVKRFIKKFGEGLTLFLALVLAGIGLLVFPLLNNFVLFITFYYLTNLGISLSFPTIRAIASREAPKKYQGKIMGIDESIFSISMAVTPFTAAWLYHGLQWKSFLIWGLISLIGTFYYLLKNFSHIFTHDRNYRTH